MVVQQQIYIVAKKYGFLPDLKIDGKNKIATDPGKFETFGNPQEIHTLHIAHFVGGCNLMLKIDPSQLNT